MKFFATGFFACFRTQTEKELPGGIRRSQISKIRGFVLIMVAVAFAFAPAKLNAQADYGVKLTSPVAGQVLYAGQKIMVEWKHTLPKFRGV